MSNAWITCLWLGDNAGKPALIPHNARARHRAQAKGETRLEMGPRPISWLAVQRTTKATIGSRTERSNGHIGTETRPRLLREAAVGNIAQWGEP